MEGVAVGHESDPSHATQQASHGDQTLARRMRRFRRQGSDPRSETDTIPLSGLPRDRAGATSATKIDISEPRNPRRIGTAMSAEPGTMASDTRWDTRTGVISAPAVSSRTIRFPDDDSLPAAVDKTGRPEPPGKERV